MIKQTWDGGYFITFIIHQLLSYAEAFVVNNTYNMIGSLIFSSVPTLSFAVNRDEFFVPFPLHCLTIG
jgi:hypothetical protein